ncbi:hypothetical protein [Mixta sp. Marseille-Q2659]|uniref:hypothetical protein n=1 Tax=Mixta sp. Marseille-Q2659 TaxID=2736607 RepID=UPI0031BB4861
MSRDTVEIANELLAENARLKAQLAERDAQIVRLTTERDALREEKIGKNSNTRDAADIYFQLVEECEIPPGGSLVQYVDGLKEQIAALKADFIRLDRQMSVLEQTGITDRDRADKAEAQIAELAKQEPIGIVKLGEYDDCGNHPDATVVCLHEYADWDNFQDGTELFTRAAPPAPVDDLVMQIRRLVHALKKSNPDSPLIAQVSDYMQRSGYWQASDCLRSVADE